MPKLLDNIREKAVEQAREVLTSQGYKALTMRDIAGRCGIAVGTLYNYFPSKEYLTGSVVLEDWNNVFDRMRVLAGGAASVEMGLRGIYEQMVSFVDSHNYLFVSGADRTETGEYGYARRHGLLLKQLCQVLEELFSGLHRREDESILVFLAESIITFSGKRYSYDQIEEAFSRILRGDDRHQ